MFRLCALAVAVLAALVAATASGASSEIETMGLDMEVSGNGPRSAGDIDQCASVAVGQTATVDVALPEPGVPEGRGASAYQFTLFYDPAVVSVTGDDHSMLLDQATGSVLIPLAQSLPDRDGIYTTGVVDFGPRGIEPAGASEIGPGVLARLTLTTHVSGVSPLVIKDVIIKSDDGKDIEVMSVLSAHLYAGQPCPGQLTATPSPVPTSRVGSQPAETRPPTAAEPRSSPGELIRSGGAPASPSAPSTHLLLLGLAGVLAGILAIRMARSKRARL